MIDNKRHRLSESMVFPPIELPPITGTLVTPPISGTMFGQIAVVTSGTPVQGSDLALTNGVYLKAHPDNEDTVWVFGATQTKANGWPLNPGEMTIANVENLNALFFDADKSGEKVCWEKA